MENENLSEGVRKTMPAGITGTGTMRMEIEPLYNEKNLDFETIKNNPILKPLGEINNGFVNMELLINRALWEYQEDKKQIDEMIESNPKYSETIILSKFQSILNHVKQIIQAQDIQKENMKRAINEMIKIVGKEYGILNEEASITRNIRKEEKPLHDEIKEIKEEKINIQTLSKDKELEEYHSELLDKDIPVPKKKTRKEGFIPIIDKEPDNNIDTN